MKAIGLHEYLPIEEENSLIEIERPVATGRDILVKINAISVNPVDTKIRSPKDKKEDVAKILGWDASGVVVQTGDMITQYELLNKVSELLDEGILKTTLNETLTPINAEN